MSVRPSALSIRFVTSAIAAMPLRILVFRGVAISCLASPIRVSSSPLCALPLPFRSNPSRTVQCLFCSLRLCSPPFLSAAVPIRALPGSSVPSPVFSGRCHGVSCQLISAFAVHGHSSAVHFPSAQSRALSFRFLWAQFHSVSVRILTPPLASVPLPLVSAHVPASPCHRRANLGESVLLSAISYRFFSQQSDSKAFSARINADRRNALSTPRRARRRGATRIRVHSTQVRSGLITSAANQNGAAHVKALAVQRRLRRSVPCWFHAVLFTSRPFSAVSSRIIASPLHCDSMRDCA